MTDTTIAKSKLAGLDTADLIGQYDRAISSHAGRHTNFSPRQERISYIVNLLTDRADHDDPVALAWFDLK